MELIIAKRYSSCIKALTNLLKNKTDINENYVVLAENNNTLNIEKELCANLNAKGFFNIEVTTFDNILRKFKIEKEILSKGMSGLILKKIMLDKKNELKSLGKSTRFKNMSKTMYELIALIKSAKVTPEMLGDLNGKEISDVLKNKILDINLIYENYEKFLGETYLDSYSSFSLLPSLIKSSEIFKNTNVIILGYSAFTKQGIEIIKTLKKEAKSLTGIFVGSSETFSVYTNEAVNSFKSVGGAELKTSNYIEQLSDEKEQILSYILSPYSYFPDKKVETDKIVLISSESVSSEAEFVAERIKKLKMDGNAEFKDILVILGDKESYQREISRVFEEYRIPYYLNLKKNLLTENISRLVLDYLKIIEKNFDRENVMSFVKNVFFCEDFYKTDKFENYVYKYNIKRKQIFNVFNYETNAELENVRAEFCLLFDDLSKTRTVKEFTNNLKKMLKTLEVESKLDEIIGKISDDSISSEFTSQSVSKVLELLDETEKILKYVRMNVTEYKNLLESAFESVEISLIPQFNDSVYVSDFSESKYREAKYIFAIGMTESVPSKKSDTALLSDEDISNLDNLKLFLEPKIKILNEREKENVCLTLSNFENKLFLTSPLVLKKGTTAKLSEIFNQFKNIFNYGGKNLPVFSLSLERELVKYEDNLNKIEYYSNKCLGAYPLISELAKGMLDFSQGKEVDISYYSSLYQAVKNDEKFKDISVLADKILDNLNSEITQTFQQDKASILQSQNLSASALETYFKCPYMYFLNKLIKLKDRDTGEFDAPNAGMLLHNIVEEYVKNLKANLTVSESDTMVETIITKLLELDKYKRFTTNKGMRFILKLVGNEAKRVCFIMKNQIFSSNFKSIGEEVRFGTAEFKALEIETEKNIFKIVGAIDRIDTFEDYARIIDYKTGKIASINSSLYSGNKIQLHLYLSAVCNALNKNPAGVYYAMIHNEFDEENDEGAYALVGQTLNDKRIVMNMDTTLSLTNRESKNINAKLKVDESTGEIKLQNGESMLSDSEMQAFMQYAEQITKKAVIEIEEGFIKPTPYDGTCLYCDYNGICGYDNVKSENTRKVGRVYKKDIVSIIENMQTSKK